MADTPENWSPADNPYAIAVSEAWLWLAAVRLAAARLRDLDDPRSMPMSSRQIDARNLVLALAQLLSAEHLEQLALEELGIDSTVGHALDEARSRYLDAVPGIQEIRNALTHFEDWARGEGRGPQKQLITLGQDQRAVARDYWGFGYDPSTESFHLGPYRIEVESAVTAATHLQRAIYVAATAVDDRAQGA